MSSLLATYKEQNESVYEVPMWDCNHGLLPFTLFVFLFFFFFCKEEKAPMETYQGDVRSMQRMSIVREKAECGSLLSLRGEG